MHNYKGENKGRILGDVVGFPNLGELSEQISTHPIISSKDTWFIPGTIGLGTSDGGAISALQGFGHESHFFKWQYYLGDQGISINFSWSGANNHLKRVEAALRLATEIVKRYEADNTVKPNIVAHSHGGNVAILALNFLADWKVKLKGQGRIDFLKLQTVVLGGTPHRSQYKLTENGKWLSS